MKRTFKLFLLVAIVATSINIASAQKAKKPFSGTITDSLSYEGLEPSQAAQMPKTSTRLISGNKQKSTIDYGPYAVVTILDGDNESFVMYLDVASEKHGIRLRKADIDKKKAEDKSPKPVVTLSDETKTIAGMKCKKATVVVTDEETGDVTTSILWYTDELGSNDKLDFMEKYEGVSGMILGTETTSGKIVQRSFASEIKKGKVKDLDFLLPAETTIYANQEEMKAALDAKFGGGGDE